MLGYWLTPAWAGPSTNMLRGHPWPIGNMSVLGFFILSGFLVQEISSRYRVQTLRGYTTFLLSRAARIYPLYWVILAVVLVALGLRVGMTSLGAQHLPGWILLWPLLVPAALQSRFLFDLTAPCLGPSWTIALDLVCYVVGGAFANRAIPMILLILLCIALAPLAGSSFYTSLQGNLALFLFGMLLRLRAELAKRYIRWLLPIAIALFLYTWMLPFGLFLGLQYILFIGAFAVILLWSFGHRSPLDLRLSNLTYALYLGQYPVLTAMKPFLTEPLGWLPWLAFTLCMVTVATALLAIIEGRLERWRRSWIPRS